MSRHAFAVRDGAGMALGAIAGMAVVVSVLLIGGSLPIATAAGGRRDYCRHPRMCTNVADRRLRIAAGAYRRAYSIRASSLSRL